MLADNRLIDGNLEVHLAFLFGTYRNDELHMKWAGRRARIHAHTQV
jgi:hypothetical protein